LFEFKIFSTAKLQTFLMPVVRESGPKVDAPAFGKRAVPTQVKAGLAILLAVVALQKLDDLCRSLARRSPIAPAESKTTINENAAPADIRG